MLANTTDLIDCYAAPRQEHSERRLDRLLPLAAAPTFAAMALVAAFHDANIPSVFCAAAHGVSSLSGMVPMYVLMSVFHSGPWLKLICARG